MQNNVIIDEFELPELDQVENSKIPELALHLRANVRRRMIEKLDSFGATDEAGAFIDRWGLEYQFVELERYGSQLNCKLPCAEQCEPILDDISGDGEMWLTARAGCFLTAESGHHVHGPVLVYHAAALCEKLVGNDDPLVMLDEVIMRQEVSEQLQLTVWDNAGQPPDGVNLRDSNFYGSFSTCSGRKILFCAKAIEGCPITHAAGSFEIPPLCLEVQPGIEKASGSWKVALRKEASEQVARAASTSTAAKRWPGAWRLLVLSDILSYSVGILRGTQNCSLIMIRFRGVPIPEDLVEWLEQSTHVQIEFSARQRQTEDGSLFIPVSVQYFPLQEKPVRGLSVERELNLIRCLDVCP